MTPSPQMSNCFIRSTLKWRNDGFTSASRDSWNFVHSSLPLQFGLTLIELLVVITIIGIIIALLMPVISTARHKAIASICTSTLRQIGEAISMYAADYDDTLPLGVVHYVNVDAECYWTDLIMPYVKSNELFYCRATRPTFPYRSYWHANCPFQSAPYKISYGMVSLFWIDPVFTDGYPLALIDNPSSTILITEAMHPSFPSIGIKEWTEKRLISSGLSPRHFGCVSLLFADFHAKRKHPSQLLDPHMWIVDPNWFARHWR